MDVGALFVFETDLGTAAQQTWKTFWTKYGEKVTNSLVDAILIGSREPQRLTDQQIADRDASEPGFAARYEFQYEQDRQRYQKSRDYWLRADERLGKVKQDGFTIKERKSGVEGKEGSGSGDRGGRGRNK